MIGQALMLVLIVVLICSLVVGAPPWEWLTDPGATR